MPRIRMTGAISPLPHTSSLRAICYAFTVRWVELYYDRRSVGQSVLVSSPHLGLMTRFLLLLDSCGFVDMGRPLWREDGSVDYNCCCLRQRSHSQVRVPRGSWPHFTVSDLKLPQPGGPGPCIYIPQERNRVARLYPRHWVLLWLVTNWPTGALFPTEEISLVAIVSGQNLGVYLAPYTMCTRCPFSGGKEAVVWNWSLPSI
jgi:hypothetical protein